MPTTYGYALLIALAHAQYLGYAVASRVHLPECVNTHIPQTYGSARYADERNSPTKSYFSRIKLKHKKRDSYQFPTHSSINDKV